MKAKRAHARLALHSSKISRVKIRLANFFLQLKMQRKKKRRKRVFNLLHGKCHWAAEVRKWKSQLIAQLMRSTVFFVAKRDRLGHECSVVRPKIFPRISFDSINRKRRWLFKSEREIYAEKFLNWFRFARWASLDAGSGLLVSTFFSAVMEPSRGKSAPEHENVAHGMPAINLKCFDAFSECLAIMERNDVIMIN